MLLIEVSAAVLASSFVIGSQFVQPSMAQDMGQMGEQAKEKIGGAVQQLTSGNQTGNQSGGVLGKSVKKSGALLPGQ
jgi:hypothetical protein